MTEPMTWGRIKRFVEEAGIADEAEVDYIDIGSSASGLDLNYTKKDKGAFCLTGTDAWGDSVQNDSS